MMTDWFEWALVVQYCHFKVLWETRSYTMLSARTTHLCSLVITSHFMYQASTKQSWFNSDVKICVFSFFLIKCLILSRKIKMNKIVSVFLCSLLYVYIVSVVLCSLLYVYIVSVFLCYMYILYQWFFVIFIYCTSGSLLNVICIYCISVSLFFVIFIYCISASLLYVYIVSVVLCYMYILYQCFFVLCYIYILYQCFFVICLYTHGVFSITKYICVCKCPKICFCCYAKKRSFLNSPDHVWMKQYLSCQILGSIFNRAVKLHLYIIQVWCQYVLILQTTYAESGRNPSHAFVVKPFRREPFECTVLRKYSFDNVC